MPELRRGPESEQSFENFKANPYPGRIAIMGTAGSEDSVVQAYALMGRSPGSKDRIFVQEGNSIRTVAPGKSAEEMAAMPMSELIYYRALDGRRGVHVVSNGAQTDPVLDLAVAGKSLSFAVRNAGIVDGVDLSSFEPDAPNFTPRITGVIDFNPKAVTNFGLEVVRRNPATNTPVHSSYFADPNKLEAGVGFGVSTYNGNGDPLPSFDQYPFEFEMGKDRQETAHKLWELLNPEYRVAVVVREIDISSKQVSGTEIINQITS